MVTFLISRFACYAGGVTKSPRNAPLMAKSVLVHWGLRHRLCRAPGWVYIAVYSARVCR